MQLQLSEKSERAVKLLEQIIKKLFYYFNCSNFNFRLRSLLALCKIKDETISSAVFEKYQIDNLEEYLAIALVQLDPKKALPILVNALNDSHVEARISAAIALSKLRSEEAAAVIISVIDTYLRDSGIKDKDVFLTQDTIILLAKVLGEIGSPVCLAQLRKLLEKEKNEKIRATVVSALAPHICESMIPLFQTLLKDKDHRVRSNAVEAFSYYKKSWIIGFLQPLLYDPHPRVRATTARVIWKLGDYDVTKVLSEMLFSKDKHQQMSAIYAIGEIKHEVFLQHLKQMALDQDKDIRRNVVIALGKFEDTNLVKLIERLAVDQDSEVRKHAIYSLINLSKSEAMPFLLDRLSKEENASIRSIIASQIKYLGSEKDFYKLLNHIHDSDARVVSNIIETLLFLRPTNVDKQAIQKISELLKSPYNRVKANVIRFLWECGEYSVLEILLSLLNSTKDEEVLSGLYCSGELFQSIYDNKEKAAFIYQLQNNIKKIIEDLRNNQPSDILISFKIHESALRLWNEAQLSLKSGQVDKCKKILLNLVSKNCNFPPAWFILGELALNTGDEISAIDYYLQAIKYNPNFVKAYYALGKIYFKMGLWEKAVQSLEKVVALYPKLIQAYYLLVFSYEKLSEYQKANEVLKKLSELLPDDVTILELYTKISFICGNIKNAIQTAQKLNSKNFKSPTVNIVLAAFEFINGNSLESLEQIMQTFITLMENSDNYQFKQYLVMLKIFKGIVFERKNLEVTFIDSEKNTGSNIKNRMQK